MLRAWEQCRILTNNGRSTVGLCYQATVSPQAVQGEIMLHTEALGTCLRLLLKDFLIFNIFHWLTTNVDIEYVCENLNSKLQP